MPHVLQGNSKIGTFFKGIERKKSYSTIFTVAAVLITFPSTYPVLFTHTHMFPHQVSITFDPFLYLPVPLPQKQKVLSVYYFAKEPHKKPIKASLALTSCIPLVSVTDCV